MSHKYKNNIFFGRMQYILPNPQKIRYSCPINYIIAKSIKMIYSCETQTNIPNKEYCLIKSKKCNTYDMIMT